MCTGGSAAAKTGPRARAFPVQRVGRSHVVADGDVSRLSRRCQCAGHGDERGCDIGSNRRRRGVHRCIHRRRIQCVMVVAHERHRPNHLTSQRSTRGHAPGGNVVSTGRLRERVRLHGMPIPGRLRHASRLRDCLGPSPTDRRYQRRFRCRGVHRGYVQRSTRGLRPQRRREQPRHLHQLPDPGVYRPPYNDFVADTSRSGTLRLVRTTRTGVTTITASRLTGRSWSLLAFPCSSGRARHHT